ncbi:MAG: hypothetical protein ACREFU_13945 [Acetobacteraceae bacterium]
MRELIFALAILAAANTASAADASWLVSPGDQAILTTDRIACPEESGLKKLQTDVFNHDKEGFIEDAAQGGCTVISAKQKVLVVGSDGWLDPWFRVRIPKQGAYWIDDVSGMDGNEPVHVLQKVNDTASAENVSPYTAALAAGQAVANQSADWYYKDDNEDGAECHALPAKTPQQFLDAVAGRGAANIEITGNDILKADAVISFELRGKNYEYSLYNSHEKCANPFGATDNTKPDFSTISPPTLDKTQQALADEALKRATDIGPWWMLDGTKTDSVCKPTKLTPMQDARSAKAKGARNIQIEGGVVAANVPHPTDVVVEYDFNGKSFFDDYYKNKDCDDSGPAQAEKDTPSRKATGSEVGNGSCWGPTDHGDNGRPDISCRALTEDFLMSMRGKTKAEVQRAMGVNGRPDNDGLHFISNYARGAKYGSGDINFLFKGNRAVVIFGSLDLPNEAGSADFIWNAKLLPAGCSDLPNTKMARCDAEF